MDQPDLQAVKDWAKAKIATRQEPPWAWYQYMKLCETIDAILSAQDATITQTENSQQSEPHPGTHLRLVDQTYSQDSAQHRPSDEAVQMPM